MSKKIEQPDAHSTEKNVPAPSAAPQGEPDELIAAIAAALAVCMEQAQPAPQLFPFRTSEAWALAARKEHTQKLIAE